MIYHPFRVVNNLKRSHKNTNSGTRSVESPKIAKYIASTHRRHSLHGNNTISIFSCHPLSGTALIQASGR